MPPSTAEQQLRVPATFAPPLNSDAMDQLSRILTLQPRNTIVDLHTHFDASLTHNAQFMEHLRSIIALAAAHHESTSQPDPHMPIAEREALAKEAIMKEIIAALRDGRLQVPEPAIAGAVQLLRQTLDHCIHVEDEEGGELHA